MNCDYGKARMTKCLVINTIPGCFNADLVVVWEQEGTTSEDQKNKRTHAAAVVDDVSLVAFPFFESCLLSTRSNHFSVRHHDGRCRRSSAPQWLVVGGKSDADCVAKKLLS